MIRAVGRARSKAFAKSSNASIPYFSTASCRRSARASKPKMCSYPRACKQRIRRLPIEPKPTIRNLIATYGSRRAYEVDIRLLEIGDAADVDPIALKPVGAHLQA